LGARAEKILLTKKLETLALRATKAMNYEIAGVDIIEHKKEFYVLEINSAPQWQKFKEVTGINPAEDIVAYSLKKYYKKRSC
jgi:glutathione synthase/RimK-type ligase-like ATP-grasp enzyme